VKQEGGIDWLAGREFWEFISDTSDCVEAVFEIARQVGEDFQGPEGKTLSQILEAKVAELCAALQYLYGASGEEMWKRLLDQNS
jgi:hypothetical protein